MSVINRFKAATQAVSDTTRRFGYSGGVPMLVMDAKKSGLDCNPIDGGRLLLYVQGKDGYIGPGVDQFTGERKKQYHVNYPKDYQTVVERAFHLNDDFGYRSLEMLTPVPYEVTEDSYYDQADEYFSVVHPTLAECSYGLNKAVQLSDPEVGESTPVYQHCPTCRLADLRSDACSERIYAASATLDSAILASLRAKLIEANEAALRYADRKTTMVKSDIARKMTGTQPGRNVLNAVDRILFKMQHKEEEQNSASEMKTLATEMAAAFKAAAVGAPAQSTTPAAPEGGKTLTAEEAAEYEAYQKRKAAMAKARESKDKDPQ